MLHENRGRAESFGADAAGYHATRPSYPDALIDALLADPVATVLDVGCGTGIASAPFVARGLAVVGIEPDPRMAAIARQSGVDTEIGQFETWDAGGRTFDLVICAQAWHWLDPHVAARRAAAVLAPGGRIGVFWNLARPAAEVRQAFAGAYVDEPELERESVLFGRDDHRIDAAVAALTETGAFGPITRPAWRWTRRYGGEEWLRHAFTRSDHAALPPERRAALRERMARVVDDLGGAVEMDYDATLLTGRRG